MGGKSSSSSSSSQTTTQTTQQTQGNTTINDYSNFFGSSVLNTGEYTSISDKTASPQNYATPYMNSTASTTQRNDAQATGASLSVPLAGLGGGVAGGVGSEVGGSLWDNVAGAVGSAAGGFLNNYNTSSGTGSYYTSGGYYDTTSDYYTGTSSSSSGFLPIAILGAVGIGAYLILKD